MKEEFTFGLTDVGIELDSIVCEEVSMKSANRCRNVSVLWNSENKVSLEEIEKHFKREELIDCDVADKKSAHLIFQKISSWDYMPTVTCLVKAFKISKNTARYAIKLYDDFLMANEEEVTRRIRFIHKDYMLRLRGYNRIVSEVNLKKYKTEIKTIVKMLRNFDENAVILKVLDRV